MIRFLCRGHSSDFVSLVLQPGCPDLNYGVPALFPQHLRTSHTISTIFASIEYLVTMVSKAEEVLESSNYLETRDTLPTDMEDRDLIALFVLDDIPNEVYLFLHSFMTWHLTHIFQTLNILLDENSDNISGSYIIWLADTYDSLPNYSRRIPPGTFTPVDADWRSPFIGKTVTDVVAFMRGAPKPPKVLNKRFCAVLTKESLGDRCALICKSLEDDSDIESESDDEEDNEDCDELIADQQVQPGTIEADFLQRGIEIEYREFPARGRDTKQVIKEMGNDFENVQVIPITVGKIAEFQYIFERQRWRQFYLEWREDGVELG